MDYPYSIKFLEKVNTLLTSPVVPEGIFDIDEYDLLQRFQEPMFIDIRRFSNKKVFVPAWPRTFKNRVAHVVTGSAILFVSIVGISALLLGRRQALVYSVDSNTSEHHSDFRIDALYRALDRTRIRYSEVFHTVPDKKTIVRFFIRRRLAWYLEATDFVYGFLRAVRIIRSQVKSEWVDELDFSLFETEDEKRFARVLIKKFVRVTELSRFRVRFFTTLFAWSNLKVFFTIDDPRHYHELLIAASKNGIRTYAVQHGHFTKYHVGWLKKVDRGRKYIAPEVLLVWSEYWKNELLRLGTYFTPEQLQLGGLGTDTLPTRLESVPSKSVQVMVPFESIAPKEEIIPYIRALISCPHTGIIFKTRPDVPISKQLREYGFEEPLPPNVAVATHVEPHLADIALVAGVYSTMLYDMLLHDKPVALFRTSMDYGEGMLYHNIAASLTLEKSVCEQVQTLARLSEEERNQNRTKVFGTHPGRMSDTIESIIMRELGASRHV